MKINCYTVKELEAAFFNYHPRWLFTARKVLEAHGNATVRGQILDAGASDLMSYDPVHFAFLGDPILQEIRQQVASQIEANAAIPVLMLTGDKLSPAIFARMLDFVKQKGLTKVLRLYKPKDPSRLNGAPSDYSWDLYSPAALLYNTKRASVRLEAVYSKIVGNNFPHIARQLELVKPEHRLIYVYDTAENAGGPNPPQGATIYEVVADKARTQKRLVFLLASERTIDTKFSGSKWLLSIDGEEFELVSRSGTNVDMWLSDTPLFDMIYKYLKRALDQYFK